MANQTKNFTVMNANIMETKNMEMFNGEVASLEIVKCNNFGPQNDTSVWNGKFIAPLAICSQ